MVFSKCIYLNQNWLFFFLNLLFLVASVLQITHQYSGLDPAKVLK